MKPLVISAAFATGEKATARRRSERCIATKGKDLLCACIYIYIYIYI